MTPALITSACKPVIFKDHNSLGPNIHIYTWHYQYGDAWKKLYRFAG